MALVTVTTEKGDIVLSLQVGDMDIEPEGGITLTSNTDAEIAHAIAQALDDAENAHYLTYCSICKREIIFSDEDDHWLHDASDMDHEATPDPVALMPPSQKTLQKAARFVATGALAEVEDVRAWYVRGDTGTYLVTAVLIGPKAYTGLVPARWSCTCKFGRDGCAHILACKAKLAEEHRAALAADPFAGIPA